MNDLKKAFWLTACGLAVAGYLIGIVSSSSAAVVPPALTDHVRDFLKSCAAAFEPWRDAEPGETATYLDLENRPAFRRHTVMRDKVAVGYLVARVEPSTGKQAPAVVEFGVGLPPDVLFRPRSKEAAERAVGSRMSVDDGDFVYSVSHLPELYHRKREKPVEKFPPPPGRRKDGGPGQGGRSVRYGAKA
jgi:hypothetical protein